MATRPVQKVCCLCEKDLNKDHRNHIIVTDSDHAVIICVTCNRKLSQACKMKRLVHKVGICTAKKRIETQASSSSKKRRNMFATPSSTQTPSSRREKKYAKISTSSTSKKSLDFGARDDNASSGLSITIEEIIKELVELTKSKNSSFKITKTSILTELTVAELYDEFSTSCPNTVILFEKSITNVKPSTIVSIASAWLLAISPMANAWPSLLGVYLKSKGVSKEGLQLLNTAHYTVSNKTVERVTHQLGRNHDKPVKSWVSSVEKVAIEQQGGTVDTAHLNEIAPDDPYLFTDDEEEQISDEVMQEGEGNVHNPMPMMIVGDNVNLEVAASKAGKKNQSLHMFLIAAVRMAVDDSNLSKSERTLPEQLSKQQILETCTPKREEYLKLKCDVKTLVKRILVNHIPQLQGKGTSVDWHIDHKYSKVMLEKTEKYPLGLLDENEGTSAGMTAITSFIHQNYVPKIEGKALETILCHGDLLTCAVQRNAIQHRHTSAENAQFQGILPQFSDFHATLLDYSIMISILTRTSDKSILDPISYLGIANTLNVRKVTNTKQDFNSIKTYVRTLVQGAVCAAACTVENCNIEEIEAGGNPAEKLEQLSTKVVEQYFSDEHLCSKCGTQCFEYQDYKLHMANEHSTLVRKESTDARNEYFKFMLRFGLILLNREDAIREGDGDRTMSHYRFMLPLYQATRHTKYAYHTLNLLLGQQFFLSERNAHRVKHNRFVNHRGGKGNCKAMDLMMENLVLQCKTELKVRGHQNMKYTKHTVTKALTGIQAIKENVFNGMLLKVRKSKSRSNISGQQVVDICNIFLEEKVTERLATREMAHSKQFNSNLKSSCSYNDTKFQQWIVETGNEQLFRERQCKSN